MSWWYGKMPPGIHLGDFLQLRPAQRRSLCEYTRGMEPEAVEEEGEGTAAELGRLLLKNAITNAFHFTSMHPCLCIRARSRRHLGTQAALRVYACSPLGKAGSPSRKRGPARSSHPGLNSSRATKEPLSGSSWRGCKPKAEGRERLRLPPRHLCVAQPSHQA